MKKYNMKEIKDLIDKTNITHNSKQQLKDSHLRLDLAKTMMLFNKEIDKK